MKPRTFNVLVSLAVLLVIALSFASGWVLATNTSAAAVLEARDHCGAQP